ncbi:glycosyltransferase family 2 protein [Patescibacteria group bacterium]|nr:glycosyltransferase family 2 protein [Patescibacteria group bacterium]
MHFLLFSDFFFSFAFSSVKFLKSFKSAFYSIFGYVLVKEWEKIDWHAKWLKSKTQKLKWHKIKHVIIIPNYNETEEKIAKTLRSFARQKQVDRENLLVFLAMEARAEGARERAESLIARFKGEFGEIIATYHPDNISGEIRGKASNETWAAKEAKKILDKRGIDLRYVTVTSCDADAIFHPLYFAALTHLFAVHENRYLRFWQSPIFWYNNFHRVPFPIKMLGVIGHAIHLSDLQEPSRLIFNYSCYSLSFKLLDQVGYWHTDIIPEDWHLFLQTFFENRGEVEVDALFLPTYIDAPEANTWFGSIKSRYEQCKRHAWGATDIPYAIKESIKHREIPLLARIMRVYKMVETHIIWSTNWFVLTLGATLPVLINPAFSRTSLGYNLPRMVEAVLTICLLALAVMVIVDLFLRPKVAKPKSVFAVIKEVVQWVTLPLVTLPLAVLPGLHAQTMIMVGKKLEYKVTEKM